MPKDDRIRMQHMLDAANEALGFVKGRERSALDHDRQLALALLKCLEIVGEAAARVTQAAKAQYTAIPWLDIVGMRNRLIHSYFEVNLDLVWETVVRDLPSLAAELRNILQKPN